MKKALLSASMVSMAILSGCGDSDTESVASAPMPDGVVKTVADLGTCSGSSGNVMQVIATGSYYRCEGGEWVEQGWFKEKPASSSTVTIKDESSSSAKKNDFDDSSASTAPKSSSSEELESSSSEEEELESSSSEEEEIESSSSEEEEELESSSSEEEEVIGSSDSSEPIPDEND